MRNFKKIAGIALIIFVLGLIGSITGSNSESEIIPTNKEAEFKILETTSKSISEEYLCDGSTVISDCYVEGVKYKTYKYYPAVAEVSHTEQEVTYKKEITGYCTLCVDGTYSPTCATGRGACSHHGGVAEWNSPRYSNVPVYTTKIVIDEPARDAYYEKVKE